jgi:hypothetical protein
MGPRFLPAQEAQRPLGRNIDVWRIRRHGIRRMRTPQARLYGIRMSSSADDRVDTPIGRLEQILVA